MSPFTEGVEWCLKSPALAQLCLLLEPMAFNPDLAGGKTDQSLPLQKTPACFPPVTNCPQHPQFIWDL